MKTSDVFNDEAPKAEALHCHIGRYGDGWFYRIFPYGDSSRWIAKGWHRERSTTSKAVFAALTRAASKWHVRGVTFSDHA